MAKRPRAAPVVQEASALTLAGLCLLIVSALVAYYSGEPLDYSGPKLALMSLGLALAWLGAKRARATAIDPFVGALIAAALASTLVSIDLPVSFYGDYRQPTFGLLQLALYLGTFYLGASLDEKTNALATKILVGTAAFVGCVCVLQTVGLGPPTVENRSAAMSGSPVAAGFVLAGILPLALSEAFAGNVLGGLSVPAISVGLWLTHTRSAYLAALVGCGVCALGARKLRGRWPKVFAAAMILVTVVGVAKVTMGRASSDQTRVEVYRGAVRALLKRPLLGWGPDSFSVAFRYNKSLSFIKSMGWAGATDTEAHNDLLQIGVTMGLAGLAAYLAAFAAFVVKSWPKRASEPRRWSAIMGTLAVVFSAAKFNPVPVELWALAAWLAGGLLGGAGEAPRWRTTGLKAWGAALAVAFFAVWVADIEFGKANRTASRGLLAESRQAIDVAMALTPARMEYTQSSSEIAIQEIKRASSPERAREHLDFLLSQTKRAAQQHAGNPQSHEVYGTAQLFASTLVGNSVLPGARAELELASSMDPTNPYSIQRRLMIAQILKDQAAFNKAVAELQPIAAVVKIQNPDAPAPGN